jgi:hypothetical protein
MDPESQEYKSNLVDIGSDVIIIDPVSPEFNRGSFCYLPYILASGLDNSILVENFNAADLDRLPNGEIYLIALWSHTQIEQVQTLLRFLPKEKTLVFGYAPLIQSYKMPQYAPSASILKRGLTRYIKLQEFFTHILLSDCDMHLSEYSGQVYPFFTSYGCPNGCSFCPSTANQPERIVVDLSDVQDNLDWMGHYGRTHIHFTDEDLFFDVDRAMEIVNILKGLPYKFQIIAMVERRSLLRFIKKYGCTVLSEAGFVLFEVGLESASTSLAHSMGKSGVYGAEELSNLCSIPILWLNLTFFPGETFKSLKETGDFLRDHGISPNKLYSRIATNGTVGGLGQFFQPYEGTRGFETLLTKGISLSPRPMRLMPSYIPNSFLYEVVKSQRDITPEEQYWFKLYQLQWTDETLVDEMVWNIIAKEIWPTLGETCTALAIAAKLGIIS